LLHQILLEVQAANPAWMTLASSMGWHAVVGPASFPLQVFWLHWSTAVVTYCFGVCVAADWSAVPCGVPECSQRCIMMSSFCCMLSQLVEGASKTSACGAWLQLECFQVRVGLAWLHFLEASLSGEADRLA